MNYNKIQNKLNDNLYNINSTKTNIIQIFNDEIFDDDFWNDNKLNEILENFHKFSLISGRIELCETLEWDELNDINFELKWACKYDNLNIFKYLDKRFFGFNDEVIDLLEICEILVNNSLIGKISILEYIIKEFPFIIMHMVEYKDCNNSIYECYDSVHKIIDLLQKKIIKKTNTNKFDNIDNIFIINISRLIEEHIELNNEIFRYYEHDDYFKSGICKERFIKFLSILIELGTNFIKNQAASKIQKKFKESISNPEYNLCKKRLLLEFNKLSNI